MARHGENIRKRADGRWEGRYKVFSEQQGKNIYRSVYGHSYSEVKERLWANKSRVHKNNVEKSIVQQNIDSNHRDASLEDDLILFSQVAEEWLAEVRTTRKYSTYVKYSTIYKKHISNIMNSSKLAEIDSKTISMERFEHLSISLQKSVCCIFNQIFNYTATRYNKQLPAFKKNVLGIRRKHVKIFSKAEQSKLIACLYSTTVPVDDSETDSTVKDKYKAAIILCMYTGLRLGELCALRWSDIDFDDKTISVKRTVQRISVTDMSSKTILMETPPKSNASNRIIPMSEEVEAILKGLDKNTLYIWSEDNPLEPRTLQYQFKRILKEADINNKGFHSLRHTFATNCVENGMDIRSLSEILGHSNVKTTLNWYVHPTLEAKREQLEKLSTFYGQICGQEK